MSNKETERRRNVGCIFTLVRLLTITPLFAYLVYSILQVVDVPVHVYYAFWGWMGLIVVLTLMQTLFDVALE